MHYHYFTLEQRDALNREIRARMERQPDGVTAALETLRTPAYGICEVCEADIPFARLIEDPLARVCGRCSSKSTRV
jgi:RNA polymerase-binding transcription factor DksA